MARTIRRKTAPKLLWYLLAVMALTAGMVALKGLLAWATEVFIYTLPLVGEWLKSLELVEVSNVLIFALLGAGLGAATRWLPANWNLLGRAIALVIAVPIVFLSSYLVRQQIWIQQVAVVSGLLPEQAERVTNTLLEEATGQSGLPGFFRFTVQVPILPTDLSALQSVNDDDKWFRSELTRYSGVEPGVFSVIFQAAGWGMRVFYILLAVVTAIIYFAKGMVWAQTPRSQSAHK